MNYALKMTLNLLTIIQKIEYKAILIILCLARQTDSRSTIFYKQYFFKIFFSLFYHFQQYEALKTENQRLKDENGALIRVISKLSK